MTKIICFLLLLTLTGCRDRDESKLEINFTSNNDDTTRELESFFLQSMDLAEFKKSQTENRRIKSFYLKKITCLTPNKFLIESIDPGPYFGLITLNKNDEEYNITIDSIYIKPGINYLSKEINLKNGNSQMLH